MGEKRYRNHFDIEFALEEEYRKQIDQIINHPDMQKLSTYYIFASSRCDGQGVIRTHFATTTRKPPKVLNSMCLRVDNRLGLIFKEWVAPLDIPIPDCLIMPETSDEGIIEQAQGLPIITA